MRSFLLPFIAVLSLNTYAQTPFGREVVVEVDTSKSAAVLKSNARKWFVDTFKNATEVIQMDDNATNTIIGKGWSKLDAYGGLHYTIEVACKDGRARIRIYDVHHKGIGGVRIGTAYQAYASYGPLFDEEVCYTLARDNSSHQKQALKKCVTLRPEVDATLDSLVASLELALKGSSKTTNDW